MTGPAFAGDVTKATTEADCDKAGGVWNAQNNECAEESAKMGKEEGTHEGHASTPENDTQKVEQPPRNNPTLATDTLTARMIVSRGRHQTSARWASGIKSEITATKLAST
jgi:hypothetical protein